MITPERVRELSAEARSNVETKADNRDDARDTRDTRWWHPDHFDQEFARLIIREVASPELKKYIFTVFDVADDDEVDTYELLAESREFAFRIITHIEKFDVDRYYVLFKVEDI